MLFLNETGVRQVFDHWGFDFIIDKNQAVYSDVVAPGRFTSNVTTYPGFSRFKTFRNIIQFFGTDKKYGLHRSHALGDVLMLKAFIDYLRDMGYDNIYGSTDWSRFDYLIPSISQASQLNCIFNLDGVLELDHNPLHPFSLKHRVDILAEVFGIKIKNFKWNMNISGRAPFDVSNTVLMQVGGSTPVKTLSPVYIKSIVSILENNFGLKVLLFGKPNNKIDFGDRFIEKALTFSELYHIINECSFLITMDSAPLWISHFTHTPVLLLHGPTRVPERLSLHPLYPELTGAVDLAGLIGCTPCFETQSKCRVGVDCMNTLPVRQLQEKIIEQVIKLEGK